MNIVSIGVEHASLQVIDYINKNIHPNINVSVDVSQLCDELNIPKNSGLTEKELRKYNYPDGNSIFAWINNEQIYTLMNDSRVNYVSALTTFDADLLDYESVSYGASGEKTEFITTIGYSYLTGKELQTRSRNCDISVKAYYFEDNLEFDFGGYNLIKGRKICQNDIDEGKPIALISDKVAEMNNLSIGDSIRIQYPFEEFCSIYGEAILSYLNEQNSIMELTIVGIYHTSNDISNMITEEFSGIYQKSYYPENIIMIPASIFSECYANMMNDINKYLCEQYNIKATNYSFEDFMNYMSINIVCNKIDDVRSFVDDYQSLFSDDLLWDYDKVNYDKYTKKFTTLISLSKIIQVITLLCSLIVISLLLYNKILDRKNEIGVFLALGGKKINIVFQIVMESIICFVLGCTLSIIIGNKCAQLVGTYVLKQQIQIEEQYADSVSESLSWEDVYEKYNEITYFSSNASYFTDLTDLDAEEQYRISIGVNEVGNVLFTELIVIFLSLSVPLFIIERTKPTELLRRIS